MPLIDSATGSVISATQGGGHMGVVVSPQTALGASDMPECPMGTFDASSEVSSGK
jgi:hypothetical protein